LGDGKGGKAGRNADWGKKKEGEKKAGGQGRSKGTHERGNPTGKTKKGDKKEKLKKRYRESQKKSARSQAKERAQDMFTPPRKRPRKTPGPGEPKRGLGDKQEGEKDDP